MQVFLLFCLQDFIRKPPQICQDIRGYRFVLLPNRTGDLYRRICRRKIHIKYSFRKGFPLFCLLKIVNVDVFLSRDAVFKVKCDVQLIFVAGYDNISGFGRFNPRAMFFNFA